MYWLMELVKITGTTQRFHKIYEYRGEKLIPLLDLKGHLRIILSMFEVYLFSINDALRYAITVRHILQVTEHDFFCIKGTVCGILFNNSDCS